MDKQQAIEHLQNKLGRLNMGAVLGWSLLDRFAVSLLCIDALETQPATKPQLLALRDTLLRMKDGDAAAACDNLIDLLSNSRNREDEERDADWQEQITELRGGL